MRMHIERDVINACRVLLGCSTAVLLAAPVLAQQSDPAVLPTVTVSGGSAPSKPGALRDDVARTESIGAKEMENSGATTVPQLLSTRPGMDLTRIR